MSGTKDEANTFRILVASDIHLGYAENDPQRGNDSFIAFEEILQLAERHSVDMILLGGDLFHDNKPSTNTLNRCIRLLRKYCMGDKPVAIEFLSDQAENFRECIKLNVNYEDPDLNIAIPVFSIHGNHDDPSGYSQVSSIDVLCNTGLVNYFGKWTDLNQVTINPLLLKKGNSRLALYGLSYIKDERLSRLFRDGKVQMYRPKQDTDKWFNVFVCHQNRSDHGINKYLPETALPDFLDLVVWGHEHECKIDPERTGIQNFFITQPGSSVATSLCDGEAKLKHVGLLSVNGSTFHLRKLRLKTVRPFVFDSVLLSQDTISCSQQNMSEYVQNYLKEKIEMNIRNSSSQLTGHPKQPTLPLIRLKVDYTDEAQCFNAIRFGQQFQSQVANPTDMILLRKAKNLPRKKGEGSGLDKEGIDQLLQKTENVDEAWEVKMNAIMHQYFTEVCTAQLCILSVNQISEAISRYIEKEDKNAIADVVRERMKNTEEYLKQNNVEEPDITKAVEELYPDLPRNAMTNGKSTKTDDFRSASNLLSDDDADEVCTENKGKRARVRGGATTYRARGRQTGRGRASSRYSDDDMDIDLHNQEEEEPSISRGRGRGRGSRARGTTSRARGRQTVTAKASTRGISKYLSCSISASEEKPESIFYNSDSD